MDTNTTNQTPPVCIVCGKVIPTSFVLTGPYGPYHLACSGEYVWTAPSHPEPNVKFYEFHPWPGYTGPWWGVWPSTPMDSHGFNISTTSVTALH